MAGRNSPAEEGSFGLAEVLGRSSCHRRVDRIPGHTHFRNHHRRRRSHIRPGTDRTVAEAVHCTAVDLPDLQARVAPEDTAAFAAVSQQPGRHMAVPVLRSPRCMPLCRSIPIPACQGPLRDR